MTYDWKKSHTDLLSLELKYKNNQEVTELIQDLNLAYELIGVNEENYYNISDITYKLEQLVDAIEADFEEYDNYMLSLVKKSVQVDREKYHQLEEYFSELLNLKDKIDDLI